MYILKISNEAKFLIAGLLLVIFFVNDTDEFMQKWPC